MQLCHTCFKNDCIRLKCPLIPLCKQLPFSPEDVENQMHFFKIVPYHRDEEINSGKQNVLTKIQYYDTLNTLPQHS